MVCGHDPHPLQLSKNISPRRLLAVRLLAVRLLAVRLLAVRLLAVRLLALRLLALRLLVLLLLLVGGVACQPPPSHGLYLSMRHTYYEPGLERLERRSVRRSLDTLYPELGIVEPETGVLRDRAGRLRVSLLTELDSPLLQRLRTLPELHRRRFQENIRVLPWVFVEGLDAKSDARLQLDLYAPEAQQTLVTLIGQLQQLGFTGVHLDVEPLLESQVPALCELLQAVQRQNGTAFFRSVFAPKLLPPALAAQLRNPEQRHPGYMWARLAPFEELLACSDEVVVPLYDYGGLVRTPEQYVQWVRETAQTLSSLPTYRTRLKLALPAYRQTPQHGSAEQARYALPVLKRKALAPAGIVYFQYTGEELDYWP